MAEIRIYQIDGQDIKGGLTPHGYAQDGTSFSIEKGKLPHDFTEGNNYPVTLSNDPDMNKATVKFVAENFTYSTDVKNVYHEFTKV